MKNKNSRRSKKKKQNEKETADAMAKNMAANMRDPNFIADKEKIQDEVRAKILKKRHQREKSNNND
ncbi:MAG: hypothetical protein EU541_05195 [Promethearchaeota archaeon]|nr:MAG: hypothetical protein EU541_05195 [Candidatus Lokiarchaeota archaeon]